MTVTSSGTFYKHTDNNNDITMHIDKPNIDSCIIKDLIVSTKSLMWQLF